MEDCYFFMTATCNKGPACPFRHCEEAKKVDAICETWQSPAGCNNPSCNLRHSTFELKNRAGIECYWETHGGCKKTRCPFRHSSSSEATATTTSSSTNEVSVKTGASSAKKTFEESKSPKRIIRPTESSLVASDASGAESKKQLDFKVKSFDEIMKEKRQKLEQQPEMASKFKNLTPNEPIAKIPVTLPIDGDPESTASFAASEKVQASLLRTTTHTAKARATTYLPPTPPIKKEENLEDDIDKQLAEIEELINS